MSKLDIFQILDHVVAKDTNWLQNLPEESQKGFVPVVVQKWLRGGTQNQSLHVFGTNELVNPYVFALWQHPILLYKLMCVANGTRCQTKFRYLKPAVESKKLSIQVLVSVYGSSVHKAAEDLALFDRSDIMEMAARLGYQKDEMKKVEEEWK